MRIQRIVNLCVVLVLAATAHRALAVEPWPQIALPPKADVQWVGQSMRVNGVPTRIMQFESRASRSEIVEYYLAHWSGGYEHNPSVKPLGQASVVGQMHGPYMMTVKVEDADRGSSRGLIAVAQVLGFKADRDPGQVPLIAGARVASVIESSDPGKVSREVTIAAPQAPPSIVQFYKAAFGNTGWRQVQANDSLRTPGHPSGSFLVFARGATEIQFSIVAMPNGRGSAVLANQVTKDTGTDSN